MLQPFCCLLFFAECIYFLFWYDEMILHYYLICILYIIFRFVKVMADVTGQRVKQVLTNCLGCQRMRVACLNTLF